MVLKKEDFTGPVKARQPMTSIDMRISEVVVFPRIMSSVNNSAMWCARTLTGGLLWKWGKSGQSKVKGKAVALPLTSPGPERTDASGTGRNSAW